MTTSRLRIEAAGPLTSVQDRGRPGWRRFGVPPSGPVDRRAFAAALAAVGSAEGGAALELSLGGLTLVCEDAPVTVAITGAAVAAIDGVDVGGWGVVTLVPGARCRIRQHGGNWGYVGLAGRLRAPQWLGSRSTHLIAELGGGRLTGGSLLTIEDARADLAAAPIAPPPNDAAIGVARVIVGPQQRYFDDTARAALVTQPFAASARFDRMGMVLDGPALRPTRIDMPSEPAVRGALQVDGDGRVSLLTADHQTTGGYPRVAVVIEPDIDRVAQLPPGTPLRFEAVSAAEAIVLTRQAGRRSAAWLAQVRQARAPRPSLLSVNLIGGVVDALRDA